jgi:hypothetical protein
VYDVADAEAANEAERQRTVAEQEAALDAADVKKEKQREQHHKSK